MPKRAKPAYAGSRPLHVFGDRVRRLREARGWSQMTLAAKCERHFTYVSQVERGERNVTILTIRTLAKALEVDPGLLLTLDDMGFTKAVKRAKRSSPA